MARPLMSEQPSEPAELEYDPVFLHARREAIVIFCTWVVALLWAVPYCYMYGYNVADPSKIKTVFGIPSWLFWGIAAPWIVANLFTTWFCFGFMKDAELVDGSDADEQSGQPGPGDKMGQAKNVFPSDEGESRQ
jgi:hypothetical protein